MLHNIFDKLAGLVHSQHFDEVSSDLLVLLRCWKINHCLESPEIIPKHFEIEVSINFVRDVLLQFFNEAGTVDKVLGSGEGLEKDGLVVGSLSGHFEMQFVHSIDMGFIQIVHPLGVPKNWHIVRHQLDNLVVRVLPSHDKLLDQEQIG